MQLCQDNDTEIILELKGNVNYHPLLVVYSIIQDV